MAIKETKTKRLEIRLTEEELRLLKIAGVVIGQTPSQLVRMFVDSTVNALKLKINKGEINLADYETLLDDKL